MRRPVTPLWLSAPSRWAALPQGQARIVLALAALFVLASWLALVTPSLLVRADAAGNGQSDVDLYAGIVDAVRHGGNYYRVTADALRAGDYPLKPFVTFRLPTLAVVQAALPDWATIALLWALAAAVFLAWYRRLVPAFTRLLPRTLALLMLAGGLTAFLQPALAPFHEVWAGLLVALSLALRQRGRWIESVAFGLAAVLIRETAALYLAIMAILAWAEGERAEALGWVAAAAVLALAVAFHAQAVQQVVRPLDPVSPGWTDMLGFGFFVRTMAASTALAMAPLWLAVPLVALSLVGWASWRDPLALRTLAILAAYALLLSVFGRRDTFYWGLLVAPTLLVGLAFVPDAWRDLVGGSLDTRRITVRRVVR